MINVIVAGAAGRMGQRIGAMVAAHPELNYAAGFEASGNPHIGKDAGEVSGFGKNGVTIAEGLKSVIEKGDVIIDFTFHEATMGFARIAAEHNTAMVIGTTGLGQEDLAAIRQSLTNCTSLPLPFPVYRRRICRYVSM